MNIFILDEAQHLCARYHADVHLNSQLKEAVQILSTVYGGPYKPTHAQHPCVRWAAESHANAIWLYTLACELHTEWMHRFGKPHGSGMKLTNIQARMAAQAPRRFVTRSPFAQAMPEQYRDRDAVKAYRAYYNAEKQGFWHSGKWRAAKWTNRPEPPWFIRQPAPKQKEDHR